MAECPCEFDPKIQVDCAIALIGMVRSGELAAKRGEALRHAGCILGSLGAYLAPDDEPTPFAASDLPCSLEKCCDEVEAVIGDGVDVFALSPAMVALLVQLAKMALEAWLASR